MQNRIFIDRRRGMDRREEIDFCEGLDVDIYHRKRRKKSDRRAEERSLDQDYDAYMGHSGEPLKDSHSNDDRPLH